MHSPNRHLRIAIAQKFKQSLDEARDYVEIDSVSFKSLASIHHCTLLSLKVFSTSRVVRLTIKAQTMKLLLGPQIRAFWLQTITWRKTCSKHKHRKRYDQWGIDLLLFVIPFSSLNCSLCCMGQLVMFFSWPTWNTNRIRCERTYFRIHDDNLNMIYSFRL